MTVPQDEHCSEHCTCHTKARTAKSYNSAAAQDTTFRSTQHPIPAGSGLWGTAIQIDTKTQQDTSKPPRCAFLSMALFLCGSPNRGTK